MNNVLNVYKPLGMTTFQAIKRFKELNPDYKNIPIAYTGRLDPMAEGVLVFLAGKKRFEAKKFQKLNKEYIAKILFGFSTDSYDLLGIKKEKSRTKVTKKEVAEKLKKYEGENKLSLPPYCSYKIDGKPMFHWARNGKLDNKEIPQKRMKVINLSFENFYYISDKKLLRYITDTINKVRGDFRQKKIIKNWKDILQPLEGTKFPIAQIRLKVSGGTYIRSIAENLGKEMDSEALLFNLKRTKVADFTFEEAIKF
ncbi:MAG TPA: hypothetical protein VKO61_00375 [Candidatus Paceibacterota bacterium]|nr:hypothetical protein [Candidatus Paceibacterota bacterium]